MNDYHGIHWRTGEARLKSFGTAGRNGKTIVKVELEVVSPHALSMIMHALQEASATDEARDRSEAAEKKSRGREGVRSRAERDAATRLALPAPPPRLTHDGGIF